MEMKLEAIKGILQSELHIKNEWDKINKDEPQEYIEGRNDGIDCWADFSISTGGGDSGFEKDFFSISVERRSPKLLEQMEIRIYLTLDDINYVESAIKTYKKNLKNETKNKRLSGGSFG